MPNAGTHFGVGAGVSALTYLASKNARNEPVQLQELLAVGLFGGVVALLPDVIDPPLSPDHRSIGHSIALSGLSIPVLIKWIDENAQMNSDQKDFAKSMVAGYVSHLVLDAETHAGLPFFD